MFHFDLRNYQSAFGRSVLHPLTLDVFALLSVFQLLLTFGLAKCENVVLGEDQKTKIKKNKKEKGAKYLLIALVLNHSFTRQTRPT